MLPFDMPLGSDLPLTNLACFLRVKSAFNMPFKCSELNHFAFFMLNARNALVGNERSPCVCVFFSIPHKTQCELAVSYDWGMCFTLDELRNFVFCFTQLTSFIVIYRRVL